MWIRHQTNSGVRYVGDLSTDSLHPVSGSILDVVALGFTAHRNDAGEIVYWSGTIGTDDFVIYNV